MNQLENYLPEPKRPTPVHGDGASVLGMLKAQNIKSGSLEGERLSDLVPVMGEFHRRMIHLQDVHNILKVGSSRERGTLANQKVVFNLKVRLRSSFFSKINIHNLIAISVLQLRKMYQ